MPRVWVSRLYGHVQLLPKWMYKRVLSESPNCVLITLRPCIPLEPRYPQPSRKGALILRALLITDYEGFPTYKKNKPKENEPILTPAFPYIKKIGMAGFSVRFLIQENVGPTGFSSSLMIQKRRPAGLCVC